MAGVRLCPRRGVRDSDRTRLRGPVTPVPVSFCERCVGDPGEGADEGVLKHRAGLRDEPALLGASADRIGDGTLTARLELADDRCCVVLDTD